MKRTGHCFLMLMIVVVLVGSASCVTLKNKQASPEGTKLYQERAALWIQLAFSQEPRTTQIRQRMSEVEARLAEIKAMQDQWDILSLKKLERELKKQGVPLDKPVIQVLAGSVSPSEVSPGEKVKVACRYQAFGGGIETSPTAQVFLLNNGNVVAESEPMTSNLYPGRYVVLTDFQIPPDQGAADYILRVELKHAESTDHYETAIHVK